MRFWHFSPAVWHADASLAGRRADDPTDKDLFMPRITTVTPDDTPLKSQPLLDAVEKKFGHVPNMIRTLAHSPAGLGFYLAQTQALAGGNLEPRLREKIALAVAGINDCDYCACAHTLAGKARGIDPTELASNLAGRSADRQTQAALDFVTQILVTKGHVGDDALVAVREAGYDNNAIVEIVAHVGMNIFTNYFNHIAETVIDFPLIKPA
jgi:uncharacterized peroxidase-related enzyme